MIVEHTTLVWLTEEETGDIKRCKKESEERMERKRVVSREGFVLGYGEDLEEHS